MSTLRGVEDVMISLATALRDRRRALGLTRARLAARSGLTTGDIAQWERGEGLPDPDQLVVLAEAVGFDEESTSRWLDAAVSIDLTGPEVAVEIFDTGEAPADPFHSRITPLRSSNPRLMDRVRSRMDEIRTPGSPNRLRGDAPKRPAPSERIGLVKAPVRAAAPPAPGIVPSPRIGDHDPDERVYSTRPSTITKEEHNLYLARRVGTTIVLIALAIMLRWSVGALNEGIGDFLDLFRTPTEEVAPPTL